MKNIALSPNFKKRTFWAIMALVLFAIIYLALITLAIGLTVLCVWAAVALIVIKTNFFTLMIGVGLIAMCILIIIFLLKFTFSKNTIDRSHLIEITAKDEPQLFQFIQEIVSEVKTTFPKKVYLSTDVNASVFYDSSFWSMFLPVKKNLQIGVGLVNTVSEAEFKAILAHEFGHFSQRTMKVGSYVYNVNRVIYNMLYENDSYQKLVDSWGSLSSYIALFARIAVEIVLVIQSLLRKVYEIVNSSYMALSREMEFHADEVAAHVAGSKPLATALLRLDLAAHSFDVVLNYYNSKITDSVRSKNVYEEQYFIMNFLARESKLVIENNLPVVNLEHLSKYNKSKLVIKNQFDSHPSTEDRVAALNNLNIQKVESNGAAAALFTNFNLLQGKLTDHLFASVVYKDPVTFIKYEEFTEEYTKDYLVNSFDKIFNNYYDNKNPGQVNTEEIVIEPGFTADPEKLFGSELIDLVYTSISLENDINTLTQISHGQLQVQYFNYDGLKYWWKESADLIEKLKSELEVIKERILANDIAVYKYFSVLAAKEAKQGEFKNLYQSFLKTDREYDRLFEVYVRMLNASYFIHQTTTFEVIERSIPILKDVEKDFKDNIKGLLEEQVFSSAITQEIKDDFNNYLTNELRYFSRPAYHEDNLSVLFKNMNNYYIVLSKTYFNSKKDLLGLMAKLSVSNTN